MKSNLESVRLTLGGVLMKEGKMFDAMDMFEQVKSPAGMFNLAQVLFASLKDCTLQQKKTLSVISRVDDHNP